jgi:hypothetical protein
MRQRKSTRSTFGELIAAVTDEVRPLVRDPSEVNRVVSCILSDLLARCVVHFAERTTPATSLNN